MANSCISAVMSGLIPLSHCIFYTAVSSKLCVLCCEWEKKDSKYVLSCQKFQFRIIERTMLRKIRSGSESKVMGTVVEVSNCCFPDDAKIWFVHISVQI